VSVCLVVLATLSAVFVLFSFVMPLRNVYNVVMSDDAVYFHEHFGYEDSVVGGGGDLLSGEKGPRSPPAVVGSLFK